MAEIVTLGDAANVAVQRIVERKVRQEFREGYGRQLACSMIALTMARDAMKRSGTAFDCGFAEAIHQCEKALTLLSTDPTRLPKDYELSTHLADTICNQLTVSISGEVEGLYEAVDEVLRLFHVLPRKEPLP